MRKRLGCKIHNKLTNVKCSFNNSWKRITIKCSNNIDYLINQSDITENSFFENIPTFQENLTDNQMIYQYEIEFSNFVQFKPETINARNTFDCFHGILNYIYYYSNCKLNLKEIKFHFSGAKNRKSLISIANSNPSKIDLYDILNIFSYTNINTQFVVNSSRNAFFGVSFLRIKVNPIAYSIRAGTLINYNGTLTSFTFQGYDEEQQEWDVLDERSNIKDFSYDGGYNLFFVHSTNKSYSSFKIEQTEPGYDGFWGFGIAGFDIHGIVSYKVNPSSENLLSVNESKDFHNDNEFSYDETIDMLDFMV